MKILVTGGAGYIGSHVVKLLLEKGEDEIVVIDNLSTGFLSTIEELQKIRPFTFIEADLSNWDEIKGIFKSQKFDAIIHFAASLIVPESVEKPLKYYLNNTANTAHLIKQAIEYGVEKFIFSSTAAVYGEPDIKVGESISEEFPTNPINPYGQSKLFSEKILIDTHKAYSQFKYIILRYFNVAGASPDLKIGQKTKNATHLIKVAAECAVGKRKKMYIFGTDYPTPDGTCIRDYIHVIDLADAHLKALNYLKEKGECDIFNVGYGKGYSVKEVIDTMKKVSGVDFPVEPAPRRPGDPAILVAKNDKITNKMSWKPKYNDLEFICKTAYEWEGKINE